jgi:DNA repair protein RadA/Sms
MDYNRIYLILAVLEKRLGLRFSSFDVYMNVIGGMRLDEPASDAAAALALISSITDKIVPDDLLAIAEIGLAGECRAVSNLESRVKEAERLGFKRVIVPYRNIEKRPIDTKMSLIPVKSVYEMLSFLSNNGKDTE